MTSTIVERDSSRGEIFATGAGLAWQVVIIVLAYSYAPVIGQLETGLGISLPWISDAFMDTYRWWPIATILCGAPLYVALKRRGQGRGLGIEAAICALATAILFTCWTTEAVLAPLREIIAKLG